MIKAEKRASEDDTDGPIKRKTLKFEGDKGIKKAVKGEDSTKADKFSKKSKMKSTGNVGKSKFSPKAFGKSDTNKFYGKAGSNKFAGKFSGSGKFDKDALGKKMCEKGSTPADGEKTDWRKFKQEKKELKLKRKQAKDSYEVSVEAKQIYEKLKW